MNSAPARFAFAASVTVLAFATLAFAWLAWRLTSVGPLSVPALVAPVERALSAEDGSLRADVEGVALRWSSRRSLPELMVLGLIVTRADGTELGRLPELSVRPSGRALVHGRLAVGAVGLSGVRLVVVRDEKGRFSLGAPKTEEEKSGAVSPALLELVSGPPDPTSPTAWLRVVRVRSAEINFDDRLIDARWTLAAADVDLRRRGTGFAASLRSSVELRSPGGTLSLPITAEATTTLDARARVDAVEFRAEGGRGRVTLADSKDSIALGSITAEGRYGIDPAVLELATVRAESNAGDLRGSATLAFGEGRVGARAEGTLAAVPARAIEAYWPPPVAREARAWVADHLADGTVTEARFTIRHEAETTLRLEADFGGMTVDSLPPLRPLREVAGSVLVTKDRLEVRVHEGEAGALRLTRGTLDAVLGEKPVRAEIGLEVDGPTDDLLAFLDERPLEIPSRFGLPTAVGGEASAQATLRLPLTRELSPGDIEVDASGRIRGDGGDSEITTSVAGGAVRRIEVRPLRFGRNLLTAVARARDAGGYDVDLSGPSLDLAPWIEEVKSGESSRPASDPPLTVDFDVDRIHLGPDTEIREARGRARVEEGRFATLDGRGLVPGGGSARLTIAPAQGGRRVELTSDRAGELLRAVTALGQLEGGTIELRADVEDVGRAPGTVRGQVDLSDFRVVRAPILAQILSVGSLDGIADLLRGEGLAFRRARLPFVWTKSRIEFREAIAVGAIGLTAEGAIDRSRERIDLRGEVIPAYALNSALGSVPILGSLLAGTDGQGVFGIEYSARGPLEHPSVETSILTALAPRRLREMFLEPFRGG